MTPLLSTMPSSRTRMVLIWKMMKGWVWPVLPWTEDLSALYHPRVFLSLQLQTSEISQLLSCEHCRLHFFRCDLSKKAVFQSLPFSSDPHLCLRTSHVPHFCFRLCDHVRFVFPSVIVNWNCWRGMLAKSWLTQPKSDPFTKLVDRYRNSDPARSHLSSLQLWSRISTDTKLGRNGPSGQPLCNWKLAWLFSVTLSTILHCFSTNTMESFHSFCMMKLLYNLYSLFRKSL